MTKKQLKEELIYSIDEEEIGGKISKLKQKLEQCQKEKEEYLSGWQRAQADFINYRRRQEELLGNLKNSSQAALIRELLPVLDSLSSGLKQFPKLKPLQEQLMAVLKKYGLEEIKAKGEIFNPNFHEAVEQVETKEESGRIVEEVQTGYLLGKNVLRASKVKVAK